MSEKNIENSISWLLALSLLMPFTSTVSADDIEQDGCNFGEAPCVFPLRTDDTSKKQSSSVESENETQGRGANEGSDPETDSCSDMFSARQSGNVHDAGSLSTIMLTIFISP